MSPWGRPPGPHFPKLKLGLREVNLPDISKPLSGGVGIPPWICWLESMWSWCTDPANTHGESIMFGHQPCPGMLMALCNGTWKLDELGAMVSWSGRSVGEKLWVWRLICRKREAPGGFWAGRSRGRWKLYLAAGGSWWSSGSGRWWGWGGADREECHEWGSPTRLDGWFCPGIKASRLLFPPSWLTRATPLPGSPKTPLSEKSLSPC